MTSNEIKNFFTFRPMSLDDISTFAEWFLDFNDVAMFERNMPVPKNEDALRESWRKSLEYAAIPGAFWFVAVSADGQPAGIAGLEAVNYIHGDAIVPCFIGPQFRKKGLATAMSISLLDLAFRQLRLFRLTTFYREDNLGTRSTLLSLGFEEEGRFRGGWYTDGQRQDVVIAGLLGSEWDQRRQSVLENLRQNHNVILKQTSWKSTGE
jgi:RimJ/RimL family protein N-acetyltransferase